ncbi:DNA-binding protein [Xanthomonas oryzae]|uniref:DNA-binding protein n=1 Tax=Xanthomonas oryzae TaxID=347 RepID=UPI003D9FC19A
MEKIVTQQAVDEAANQILKAGAKPTFRAVQQRVGGSFTTIKPLLRDWEERQGRPDPQAIEVPEAVRERGAEMVRMVYAAAHQEAQRVVTEVREWAAEEVDGAKAELAEATEEVARLEAEVSVRDQQIESLKASNRDQEIAISRLEERAQRLDETERALAETRSALVRAEQKAADLQAQLDAAPALTQQLADLQQRLDQLATGAAKKR